MKRILMLVACACALSIAIGCTHPIATMGLIVPGTANADSVRVSRTTAEVEAKDGRLWFLFIPLDNAPNIGEVSHRALDMGKGDFLKDARLYETGWSLLLFSYGSYSIQAKVGDSEGTVTRSEVIGTTN